ncbi:pyridoxamine 5'-phosphate oxidase family protein [Bacillus thuringiensis]|uniref:pyridoxamine 5'-phosphate oxidase family protein n=1 Tax=Bacillus thuringiensis TaxID=1428 RepID=UPI00156F464D|nr:pyridoxamine 5'-phosphate oxidase family protein [Bacillus thuringiensis]
MDVFHSGERAVHNRLGVQKIANTASTMIQPIMTKKFMAFLNGQNSFMISSMDEKGRVWSSFLAGKEGIIQAVDCDVIKINVGINEGDPLFTNILHNKEVGIIVIDFASRIRIRINGSVVNKFSDGSFEVKTEQVFGNCPKYIQARNFTYNETVVGGTKRFNKQYALNEKQQELISQADTFIIASSSSDGKMDISHRGGMPGFIHIISEQKIVFPDYSGNMLFNTLGNIIENPNVGLLFFDFSTGDTLQLTGKASIIWDIDESSISQFPGAQRLIQFQLVEAIQTMNCNRNQWEFVTYSSFNPK